MRESDYPKVHRQWIAVIVILLLLFGAFAPAAMAQVWPRCYDEPNHCNANDASITDAWIVADPHCTPGVNTSAELWVTFSVNRANGPWCIVSVVDVYVDDNKIYDDLTTSIGSLQGSSNSPYQRKLADITWPCGSKLDLKDVYAQWYNNNKSCVENCDGYGPAKCNRSGPYVVSAPLIAHFEFDNVCFCTYTQFTNKTTGGVTPYIFDWNFNDSSAHSSDENPSHHYGADGIYNVTLTVTDSNTTQNTDSQIYAVEVYQNPIANAGDNKSISAGGSVEIGGSPTASNGTFPYTYSWSPTTGLNDATIANPTASPASTTTYTVEVNDTNGCVDSDNMTVYISGIEVVKTASLTGACPLVLIHWR